MREMVLPSGIRAVSTEVHFFMGPVTSVAFYEERSDHLTPTSAGIDADNATERKNHQELSAVSLMRKLAFCRSRAATFLKSRMTSRINCSEPDCRGARKFSRRISCPAMVRAARNSLWERSTRIDRQSTRL